MRPIFGFTSCAARLRIFRCARSAARRFTRIWTTWTPNLSPRSPCRASLGTLTTPMAISTEERRIVTVLFADMAGSTALGEELDPEEMRRLLGRYYSIARESVEQHGGTVEKFIGDAVMAVFGLPTAHGDDPDRAVAAACAMRDRIKADTLLDGRIAIRFGVSTGEVVASRDQSAGDFLI